MKMCVLNGKKVETGYTVDNLFANRPNARDHLKSSIILKSAK